MVLTRQTKVWTIIVIGSVAFMLMGYFKTLRMDSTTPNVTRVSQNDFTNLVLASTKPVVVDFYATWCAPCRVLDPMLDRLAPSFTNALKFVKVNADEAQGLAQKYSVIGFPTLLVFKDGKLIDTEPGLPTEIDLKERLEALTVIK